jgi:hypothetical protein
MMTTGGGSASSGLQSLDESRLRDHISIPSYPSVLSPTDSIHPQCQVFIDCLSFHCVIYHDSRYLLQPRGLLGIKLYYTSAAGGPLSGSNVYYE